MQKREESIYEVKEEKYMFMFMFMFMFMTSCVCGWLKDHVKGTRMCYNRTTLKVAVME